MIVTIHQPEHLPWLGFFHKVFSAELFVILDNVQYRKNYFQNRNLILGPNGPIWVTVPVLTKGHINRTIAQMEIAHDRGRWQRKYWGRLEQAYQKHPYFRLYAPRLKEIIFGDWRLLVDLNIALISFFFEAFHTRVRMVRASDLDVKGNSSELLMQICKKVGAKIYLSGPTGCNYLDETLFREEGIDVCYHHFDHPVYRQQGMERFVPNLSSIDLLMNLGPEAITVLGIE